MTEKLYDLNPYDREFDAKVTDVTELNGKTAYVFDRTLFFPEEGGQSPDKGTVNGFVVTDVKIKEDTVYHFVDGKLETGDEIHGVIDWEHRFLNMQCHSAEHCFSGLVHSKFQADNVGFHLSDNTATMDYNKPLSPEDISFLEKEVNRLIIENRVIKAEYPDKSVLDKLEYRSKKELSGAVRIVTVEGVDVCACCAPHVRSTGEIGFFKVIDSEKYKGGVRIYYLAGFRALSDYNVRLSELKDIERTLSVKAHCEPVGVKALKADNERLRFELTEIKNRFIESKIKAGLTGQEKYILYIGESSEIECLDMTARFLRKLVPSFSIFMGKDEDGYRFVAESEGVDAKALTGSLKDRFGAKCGGKDGSVRGSVSLTGSEIRGAFSEYSNIFGESDE